MADKNRKPVLIVAISLLMAVAGGLLTFFLLPKSDPQNPPAVTAQTTAPLVPDAPDSLDEIAVERPTFDVVRVDADGRTLVAGRSLASSDVNIMVDGIPSMTGVTDTGGRFALFLDLEPSRQPRTISLMAQMPDGTLVISTEQMIVSPFDGVNAAEVASQTSPDAPEVPSAPVIVALDEDGLRLAQASQIPPEASDTVALDAIGYDGSGDVQLTGRGDEDSFVRIYVDNKPVTTAQISDQGQWQMELPQVDAGTYTLRIDEVNTEGEVTSRVETPFKREAPSELLIIQENTQQVSVQTVQPGATLWAIAEERYGDGYQYLKVFEANRDRIRNPDLIYPGQIFTVPD
ncbi:LysM peptidoglycan-binding domain-containing protein [Parasulfitobacter algicola]|uniref:LysM peptidoglycan-binding domain-containing protein n=1 Tax=Parasulfitobacter algicola TaxID=2614809 RepID=A0ABX2IZW6_9RHOB|nr:LysM peptidoglycan-binding domain-containing protein [Sulfitobacter algicola]NSX56361.1 LysM peptidoglycan-binding domain-containing protein [Sulfitobacter algicola]